MSGGANLSSKNWDQPVVSDFIINSTEVKGHRRKRLSQEIEAIEIEIPANEQTSEVLSTSKMSNYEQMVKKSKKRKRIVADD